MDIYRYYNKRPEKSANKKEQSAMTDKQTQDRKILNNILNIAKSIFQRQNYIKQDTENILRSLNNFSSLNIPCQIPNMTPKQLYLCYKGGWTLRQLSGLSGLDEMVVKTKIETYRQNNT